MKIGLIGINMYPKNLNFACGLHVWAFQQFLLQHGIEAVIVDYKPVYFDNFDLRCPLKYYRRKFRKKKREIALTEEEQERKKQSLNNLREIISQWKVLREEREVRYDKFQAFIDAHYMKTEEEYDSDLLEIKDPGFDCYICVTDVIWKTLPTHTYDRGFFLASKAMEGKEKISYAASRGVPKPYTQEQKELFFHYVNDIDDISVREESLKNFIEENSRKKAELVLDPVLLQDKTFWQKLSVKPKEQGYVLLYYVMEQAADTIKRAVEYAKKYDLLIVELSDRSLKDGRVKDDEVRHIAKYDIGMEEWLGYIEYADCIFTNSFHGCCFSIIFEKLFYVGRRKGDKVTNILETFGLQQLRLPQKADSKTAEGKRNLIKRIFTAIKRLPQDSGKSPDIFSLMPQSIDYSKVRRLLEEQRNVSEDFILTAISRAEKRFEAGEKKDLSRYDQFRRGLTYPIHYISGSTEATSAYDTENQKSQVKQRSNGILEYLEIGRLYQNDGSSRFEKNGFQLEGHKFAGWKLRIQIDNRWFWYMKDGSLGLSGGSDHELEEQILIFDDKARIPHIPVNRIRKARAEAVWIEGQ